MCSMTAWSALAGRTITVKSVMSPAASHVIMSIPWTLIPPTRVRNSSTALSSPSHSRS